MKAQDERIRGRLEVLDELWGYINSPSSICSDPNPAKKNRTEQSWLICQIAVKRQEAQDALKESHA